jgi:hypothetical protein
MATSQATQADDAATEAAVATADGLPAGERLSLEEMTRIMDVATTLRKERAIVDQQLNIDQIKAKLRERLLEAAKVSGDPVTEEEIAAAVEQYFDRLHEFQEPPASLATFAAHVWVRRGPILKTLTAVVVAIGVIWGMLAAGLLPGEARDRRIAEQRQAAIASEFETVERAAAAIRELSSEADVERDLSALVASSRAAQEKGDDAALRSVAAQLAGLQQALEMEYTVAVVNRPGEPSGTQRNWTDEKGMRSSGFYVFVEARDARGNPVQVPIHSRETDRTEVVSRGGKPEAVFDRWRRYRRRRAMNDSASNAVVRASSK